MRSRHILSVAFAIVLAVAGLAVATAGDPKIGVRVFQFQPKQLEISAGTTVTWTNEDAITHTVTSGTPEMRDGRFDQRLEGKGTTSAVTFQDPGLYPYFCDRHPSMRGEVRVN